MKLDNERVKRLLQSASILAIALVMGFLMAGLQTGCSGSAESNGTKTITDAYDRSVSIPADVKSAATVGSGARIVVYAGAQDKLIAVTDMEHNPIVKSPYSVVYQELFAKLPSTSNGNHLSETSVDIEALIELAPDVIISSRSASECDDLQTKTGIPVVGVKYQNDLFGEDLYNSILCVGTTLGTESHAKSVVNKLKDYQKDLSKRTSKMAGSKTPSAYAGGVNYKGAKSITGTFAGYPAFDEVNIYNVADSAGISGSFDTDVENLIEWNPTYIFLNPSNMKLYLQDWAKYSTILSSLDAFKIGNVYSQPSFNYNGTNVELGICNSYYNGMTVWGDDFGAIDFAKTCDEIFNTLLGSDFYTTLQDSGQGYGKLEIK